MFHKRNKLLAPALLALIAPTLVVPIPLWHHHEDHSAHRSPLAAGRCATLTAFGDSVQDAACEGDCPLCVTAVAVNPTASQPAGLCIPYVSAKAASIAVALSDHRTIHTSRARGPPQFSVGV